MKNNLSKQFKINENNSQNFPEFNFDVFEKSFRTVGQTFKSDKDKQIKHAADYFSSSESEEGQIAIKKNKDLLSISSFTSDEEENKNEKKIVDKKHKKREKKKKKKYKAHNYFELEDSKSEKNSKNQKEILSAEDIISKLLSLDKTSKKTNFLEKFELKQLKFKDLESTFTYDSLRRDDYYYYGACQKKEVPLFSRIRTNSMIGIKNSKISKLFMKELNEMIGVYKKEKKNDNKIPRFFDKKEIRKFSEKDFHLTNSKRKRYHEFDFHKEFIHFKGENENISSRYSETILDDENLTKVNINYDEFDEEFLNEKIILNKNKEFYKILNEDPTNIKVWFDYLKFQDEYIQHKNSSSRNEIKLQILQKALTKNPENLNLNVYYLRIFEKLNLDNFELVNKEWIKKFDVLSNKKEYLEEYLTFLKSNRNSSINFIRDNYLILMKYFESRMENSKNEKKLFSQFQIIILFDLICIERASGYLEKSFSILRSFLELNLLKSKNILKNKFIDDYVNYFESEYPKLGDFENSKGFLDYIQKTIRIDENLFTREDFIENFRKNNEEKFIEMGIKKEDNLSTKLKIFVKRENEENYRSLNITYDKKLIEKKIESFIFYSDIKDFVEMKITK